MTTSLVLIRHAESTKNTTPRFSAIDGNEQLTDVGCDQLVFIAKVVEAMRPPMSSKSIGVFSPPNARAIATARVLAPDESTTIIDDLAPIRSPYPGMTEEEVARRDPEFARLVSEYRKGLCNAYDIPRGSGESIVAFERRVASAVDEVLHAGFDVSIVIGHRSSITATLLRVLRTLGLYPQEWYGHVTIPIGSVSTVFVNDERRFAGVGALCDDSLSTAIQNVGV